MISEILDLSILSEEARKEIADFYEFLKTKYPLKAEIKTRDLSKLIPRKIEAFTPFTREQAHER